MWPWHPSCPWLAVPTDRYLRRGWTPAARRQVRAAQHGQGCSFPVCKVAAAAAVCGMSATALSPVGFKLLAGAAGAGRRHPLSAGVLRWPSEAAARAARRRFFPMTRLRGTARRLCRCWCRRRLRCPPTTRGGCGCGWRGSTGTRWGRRPRRRRPHGAAPTATYTPQRGVAPTSSPAPPRTAVSTYRRT